MIVYPNKLENIFNKLITHGIRPIIIGGYVRDFFLNRNSKDIDVELYGLSSFSELETILQEFGSVNSVGKSFGVCKLNAYGLDIDFSFPRLDSKISSGHKGFEVVTDANLDFKMATSRRDFTVNAIGYDVKNKKILDPFNGLADLKNGLLRAVNIHKFSEDPLRVLRAVQFSARFEFTIEKKLFSLLQEMIQANLLQEVPQERIFEEFKKILYKSQKPSLSLEILQQLGAIQNFSAFTSLLEDFDSLSQQKLTHKQQSHIFKALTKILSGDFSQTEVLHTICIELQKEKPFIQGRDLIGLGFKPSKRFHHILSEVYIQQQKKVVLSKEDALLWVRRNFKP